jgi:predicted RecB family nuclease
MDITKIITDELLKSFVDCSFKGYLLLRGESGNKSDYELLQQELKANCSGEILRGLQDNKRFTQISRESHSSLEYLKRGKALIVDTQITHGDLSAHFDGIEKIDGNSSLGTFYYVPIIFSHSNKVPKEETLLLAFRAILLSRIQKRHPEYGRLIYGVPCKTVKINLKKQTNEVTSLIEKLKNSANEQPLVLLNQHCQICEFKQKCREKAIMDDNISLLGNINKKEIIKLNQKGIFTLT